MHEWMGISDYLVRAWRRLLLELSQQSSCRTDRPPVTALDGLMGTDGSADSHENRLILRSTKFHEGRARPLVKTA